MMKTVLLFWVLFIIGNNTFGQKIYPSKNLDAYVGTWVYQKSDTIFKIILQKGQRLDDIHISNGLFGGYWLIVKGKTIEKYWTPLPQLWNYSQPCPQNQYMWVSNSTFFAEHIDPNYVGVIFYDQRKKHFGGKGITGGYIQLLSSTKIRWKLDEEKGIWNETEGDESISDAERRPIGFSVPDDVIMTKE